MNKIALCLISLAPALTWGEDLCTPNALRVDVCRAAATISQTISEEVPIRLNKGLVLKDIESSGNVIRMKAVFDYTQAHLVETSGSTPTLDAMRISVRDAAFSIVCRRGTELEEFIELGGKLQFMYLFSDNVHFLTVDVDRCSTQRSR